MHQGRRPFASRVILTTAAMLSLLLGLLPGSTLALTPPSASPDDYTIGEDTPLVMAAPGVLVNDVDADGEPLTAELHSLPNAGTVTLNADGSFSYWPDHNFYGLDSFTYRPKDASGLTGAATVVHITVIPVNDAPVGNNDNYMIQQDQVLSIVAPGVLANDIEVDGDTLTAMLAMGPAHGTVTLNMSGFFTYQPAPGYSGPDSFRYQASDGWMTSAPTWVNITVLPVNQPPTARADNYSVGEDTILTVAAPGLLANDTDPEGGQLRAVLVTDAQHGQVTLSEDGSFGYIPAANFCGTDSFTYQARDGGVQPSAPATVTVAVACINDPPVAMPDAYSLRETDGLWRLAPGVMANDFDLEGDVLTAQVVTPPEHGTLTLNPDGELVYQPDRCLCGGGSPSPTDSFTYRVSDGQSLSQPATVSLTITPVNETPYANPDSYTVSENGRLTVTASSGLVRNDWDPDGDILSAVLDTSPAYGQLTLTPDGAFDYTPTANWSGTDNFTYRASDGSLASNLATVTITVLHVNQAPTAAADSYTVSEDVLLTVAAPGILANDSDVEGDALTAQVTLPPQYGTLTLTADGGLVYQPAPCVGGSSCTDSFTYVVSDGQTLSKPTTVTLTILPVNETPAANPDTFTLPEDSHLVITAPEGVVTNDADPDGDTLSAVLVTAPTQGQLTLAADGGFEYTPAANWTGTDSFSYRAFDGSLYSEPVTVTLQVTAVNDPPVAAPDAFATQMGTPLTISPAQLLANDSDVEQTPLTVTVLTGPAHGTLVKKADGTYTYTPAAKWYGTDSFTYAANDGQVNSAPVTVTITVARRSK